MANSVDLHLNIQNSLEKQLTKSNKQMTSFNDLLSESDLASGRIKQKWVGMNDIMGKTRGMLRSIGSTARQLVPTLSVLFSSAIVIESTREVIRQSQAFRELAHQMGDGVKATRAYTDAMLGASRATGLATEDIQDVIQGLSALRVPVGNIEQAAIITAQFSEATGIAASSSARLYGELMRTGRMGEQATQSILLGLANVQKEFGLSVSGAEALSSGLVTITQRMNQLGKSSRDIQRMTQGTVALAVAFEKVGIEADEALRIVDDLLNPERVEENAFLYAKLGISIRDAFEGNVDVVGQMIPRMRELGQQMQGMSGPAAAAMAKSLGVPLATLRQFGEIDISQIPEMQRLMSEEGMNASEAFAAMQKETRGLDKIISAIGNQVRSFIGQVANNLGPLIEKVVEQIRGASLDGLINQVTKFGEKILNYVSNIDLGQMAERLVSGIQTFIGMISRLPKMIPIIGVSIFLLFRTMRRRFYSAVVGMGKDMTQELTSSIEGAFSMVDKRSKQVSESIVSPRGEPDRPGIFSEEAIQRRNKAMLEGLNITEAFTTQQLNIAKTERMMHEGQAERIQKRMDHLSERRSALTYRELDEFRHLSEERNRLERNVTEATLRERRIIAQEEREKERQLNRMNEQQLYQIGFTAQEELKNSRQNLLNAIELNETLESRKELTSLALEDIQRNIKEQKENGLPVSLEMLAAEEKANLLYQEASKQLTEKGINLDDLNEKLALQENNLERINDRYKELTGRREAEFREVGLEIEGAHGFLSRVTDTISQGYKAALSTRDRIVDGIRNSVGSLTDSLKVSTQAFVKNLRENTGRAVLNIGRRAIAAPLQGIGRMLRSNIGRMIGPMALIGIGMKLLQPLIQELTPVIDILTGVIQNVLVKILQAIGPPLLRVLSSLMPILAALVNIAIPPLVIALGGVMKVLSVLVTSIGWLVKGLNAIPLIGGKLDGVVKSIENISEDFREGSEQTIEAGKEMWKNKVIDDKALKSIQNSLNSTADRFASGEIVLNTKEVKEDKFGGATVSLDDAGNIRIDYPEIEDKEKDTEDRLASLVETALQGANALGNFASQFEGDEFQGLHTAVNQIGRLQDAFEAGEIGHDGFLIAYKNIFEGLINDESLPKDLRDSLKQFYSGIGSSVFDKATFDGITDNIKSFNQSLEKLFMEGNIADPLTIDAYFYNYRLRLHELGNKLEAGLISTEAYHTQALDNFNNIFDTFDSLGIEVPDEIMKMYEELKGNIAEARAGMIDNITGSLKEIEGFDLSKYTGITDLLENFESGEISTKAMYEGLIDQLGEALTMDDDLCDSARGQLNLFIATLETELGEFAKQAKELEEINQKGIFSRIGSWFRGLFSSGAEKIDDSFYDSPGYNPLTEVPLSPEEQIKHILENTFLTTRGGRLDRIMDTGVGHDIAQAWSRDTGISLDNLNWGQRRDLEDHFKEMFEVRSPSRMFERIGNFLGEGLMLGMSSGIRENSEEIQAKDIIPEIREGRRSATTIEREHQENQEMINSLQQIVEGITGLLQETRKSSESLEKISVYSNKTVNNTRGTRTPTMENI